MRIHHVGCLALLLAPLGACVSSPQENRFEEDSGRLKVTTYDPSAIREQSTVGTMLVRLDRSIQQWTYLFLTGREDHDERTLRGLEGDIRQRAEKMFDVLVEQLETGPPYNRRVAAAALGFTRHGRAMGPLLNSLSDPDPDVIANGLLGLSILRAQDTPVNGIAHHLRFGSDETIRSNAALALFEVLSAGSESTPEVIEAARSGMHDPEPLVRTKSALILASIGDIDSINDLALQLYDDKTNAAAMAAGRSLAYMGLKEINQQGRCARALVNALGKVNGAVKESVLADLRKLSNRNYSDAEGWITWANRLP